MVLMNCLRTSFAVLKIVVTLLRIQFLMRVQWILGVIIYDRSEWIELMKQMEESKFDSDHYLSDYFYGKEDYLYKEFVDILCCGIH